MFVRMFIAFALFMTGSYFTFAQVPPTLILKNQYGEQSNNTVLGGSLVGLNGTTAIAANTVVSNLQGTTALPQANTYANVSEKLLPTMLLTGFTAGTIGASIVGTDTVIQGLQKLAGNKAAAQADSEAGNVGELVDDFNALLAKLRAANLMASP